MPNKLKLHPLLTEKPDGSKQNDHYDKREEPAILTLEKEETINALIDWSRITAKKYPLRLSFKDPIQQELDKQSSYNNYNAELQKIRAMSPNIGEMLAVKAYELLKIEWRY